MVSNHFIDYLNEKYGTLMIFVNLLGTNLKLVVLFCLHTT